MAAMTASQASDSRAGDSVGRVIRRGGIAYWLSGALAVAAAGSSLATFLIAGVLHGTAVMNGSARGTSLVVLLVGAIHSWPARCWQRRGDRPARC